IQIAAVANNERRKLEAIALNKDGSLVAAALFQEDVGPQILIWKVATQEPLMDGPLECGQEEDIYAIEFSPDSSRIATGGIKQVVTIWSLAGSSHQTPVTCHAEHTGTIRSVAFSPDGKIFTTASGDTTLILWDVATGAQIAPPLT